MLHIANHETGKRSGHPQPRLWKGRRLDANSAHPSLPVFLRTDGSKQAVRRITPQLSVDSLFRAIAQVCTSPGVSRGRLPPGEARGWRIGIPESRSLSVDESC